MNKTLRDSNIALTLAIISIVGWIIPIIGIPVAASGIIFSTRSFSYTKSAISLAICILALLASVINAGIGAINGYNAAANL